MMRPSRAKTIDRTLACMSAGAFLAAGVLYATDAHAETLTTEGIFMRPGTTAKAFGGAFCPCTSVKNPTVPWGVSAGATKLGKAVEQQPSKVTVMGFSLGAAVIDEQLARWSQEGDAPEVRVVTFGNPNNPRDRDRDFTTVVPQSFERLNVVAAYDMVADKPARWGFYSQINLSMAQHFAYFDIDVNDPDNLVYREGATTHMLVKPDVLPMLKWRDWFTPDERMAELDAKYRPLVEKDYTRPAYQRQGEGADWANDIEPESLREESSEIESSDRRERSELNAALSDETEDDPATTDPAPTTAAGSSRLSPEKDDPTTENTDADADTNGGEGDGGEE